MFGLCTVHKGDAISSAQLKKIKDEFVSKKVTTKGFICASFQEKSAIDAANRSANPIKSRFRELKEPLNMDQLSASRPSYQKNDFRRKPETKQTSYLSAKVQTVLALDEQARHGHTHIHSHHHNHANKSKKVAPSVPPKAIEDLRKFVTCKYKGAALNRAVAQACKKDLVPVLYQITLRSSTGFFRLDKSYAAFSREPDVVIRPGQTFKVTNVIDSEVRSDKFARPCKLAVV